MYLKITPARSAPKTSHVKGIVFRVRLPSSVRQSLPFVILFLPGGPLLALPPAPDPSIYGSDIRPILARHCFSCHGPDKQKGSLRLDTLDPHFKGPAAETWHDVLENLKLGEMPPEDEPQPDAASRRLLKGWVRAGLEEAARQRRGIDGRTVIRRLTRYEYNNTLRDLLGIEMNHALNLPPDPASPDGFRNNGASLGISPLQIEYYLKAARSAMDKAIVTGPAPEVFRHSFTESSPSTRGKLELSPGNHMRPGSSFFGKLLTFPREGEFRIRIRAGANVPEGMAYPRMRVSLGMRSDTQSPARVVGEIDVTNPGSVPRLYELRGRIEEFPLPGHNPKFPGVTIIVTNIHDDGLPPDKPYQFRAIAIPGPLKKEVGKAVKANRPVLPVEKDLLAAHGKALGGFTRFVDGLQRKIEELRVIDPLDKNQVDIAFRLFEVNALRANMESQVRGIGKRLRQPDLDAFWERFQKANRAALARHEGVVDRFRGVEPIDRRDKARLKELIPRQQERSTIVLESLEFEGPFFQSWPPAGHVRLLPPGGGGEHARAREALSGFITRAYRRPATEADVDVVLAFYEKIRPVSSSFEEAMRECFSMILVSPEFLYLFEPEASGKSRSLTPHEIAARLSFFLWSTTPDDSLIARASSGALNTPAELSRQVRSMIKDPRSEEFIRHFTDQWLDLSGIDRVAINPEYYPGFDDRLKPMMREETRRFFGEILHGDLSALNLIDSSFTMLNEPLARHYGLKGPRSGAFERVALKPGDHRGGLLTQAGILLLNSTGEDSHPVRRAVWVLDRLLDNPPAPPPADVPGLEADDPRFQSLPVRRQLELHSHKEACADCHQSIDPWGIPFEHYDAVGLWREAVARSPRERNGKKVTAPIEDQSILPGGHQVHGVSDLKAFLLKHRKRRFATALTSRLLAYGLGRSLSFEDAEEVESLTNQFEKSDYRLGSLLVAIAQSETFRRK